MNQKNWRKNFGQTPRPCTETLCLSDFWSSNPAKGETYSSDTTLRELIASVATKKEWATSAATQTRVTVSRSRNQATVETWWNQAKGCGKPELRGVETTCTSKNENSFHPKPCVPAHFCVQYLIAWKSCPRNSCSVKRGSHQYIFYQKKLITLHPLSSALWYRKKMPWFFQLRFVPTTYSNQTRQKKMVTFFQWWHLHLVGRIFFGQRLSFGPKKSSSVFFPAEISPGENDVLHGAFRCQRLGRQGLGCLGLSLHGAGCSMKTGPAALRPRPSRICATWKIMGNFFWATWKGCYVIYICVSVVCAFMKM